MRRLDINNKKKAVLSKQAHMCVSEHLKKFIISWKVTSGCVLMEIQTNSLIIIISEGGTCQRERERAVAQLLLSQRRLEG